MSIHVNPIEQDFGCHCHFIFIMVITPSLCFRSYTVHAIHFLLLCIASLHSMKTASDDTKLLVAFSCSGRRYGSRCKHAVNRGKLTVYSLAKSGTGMLPKSVMDICPTPPSSESVMKPDSPISCAMYCLFSMPNCKQITYAQQGRKKKPHSESVMKPGCPVSSAIQCPFSIPNKPEATLAS